VKAEVQSKEMKKLDQIKRKSIKSLYDGGTPSLRGTLIKIIFLALVDGLAVFTAYLLIMKNQWLGAGGVLAVALVVSFLYLRRGGLPAKYLTPGVLFLLIFQVYVVVFSGYISFTNYGSMHNSDRASAVNAIKYSAYSLIDSDQNGYLDTGKDVDGDTVAEMVDANGNVLPTPADGSIPAGAVPVSFYSVAVVTGPGSTLNLLATETKYDVDGNSVFGKTYLGANEQVMQEVSGAVDSDGDGVPDTLDGYKTLSIDKINSVQEKLFNTKVFVDDTKVIFIRTEDGALAYQYKFDYKWDAATETFTRVTDGAVFKPAKDGFFHVDGDVAKERIEYEIGWIETVGWKNYEKIFNDERLRGPLLKIISWTFMFAIGSVTSTFVLGLALALLFNRENMRGKKIYRAIMILPYAFPGFLSAYVWKGMFNTDNGFINNVILAPLNLDAPIPWLTEEGPARMAVLLANLWLGFPYMFLISTGALQAIPAELTESATLDGATPWQQLRLIKFPLLMITLAPLLVASFAYNFNNFTLIYLLTGGGPTDITAGDLDAGGTDILITFVYKIAFSTGVGRDYGLASAFSVLIFLFVGTISFLSFRRTRALEDIA
jgi:arabinogalactan oligomer/maltooligosaccharide transport system permease protein